MGHLHYRRGEVLFGLGRYEEAEWEFSQSLTGETADASAHYARALCFYNLWLLAEGETAAKQALILEPDNPANHYALAICVVDQTAVPEWQSRAEAVVQETLRFSPQDADVWSLLARLRTLEQRWSDVVDAAVEGLRHDPRHLQCFIQRGNALMMMKATAEAEISAREALAIAPESASAHSLLGQVLLCRNDYASSESAFLDALRLEPDRIAARRGLRQARRDRLQWFASSDADSGLAYIPELDHTRPRHGPNCAFLADQLQRNRQSVLDCFLEKGLRVWIWLPVWIRAKGRNDIVSYTRMLAYSILIVASAVVTAALIFTEQLVPTPRSVFQNMLFLLLAATWLTLTVSAFWLGGYCKNYLERKLALARWQFSPAQIKEHL